MEADYEGFSIREYTRNIRSVEVRKCWPFSGEITGDLIHSLLPPITVYKFRWWSHELASLLSKSPVTADDSDPAFPRKAKAKSKPCKKRSIAEIFAAAPREDKAAADDSDVFIGSKRKKTKDLVKIKSNKLKDSLDAKTANKVNNCQKQARENADDGIKERSSVMSLSKKKARVRCSSEFRIPGILKPKRKVCSVKSPDNSKMYASQCERHVRFSDQSGIISQLEKQFFSVESCCLQMSRLSLFSAEDQSFVTGMKTKVLLNDQTSDNMQLKSWQQNKFQPAVSERRLSHAREKSGLSCFPQPHHISLERVEDALDLERMGHMAQPIQSFMSTSSEIPYRRCSSSSQPASADMHWGTLLNQSPFNPLLVEWMQKSVLYRQRHVEEAISAFPLNLQGELVGANGEGCRSFDRSGLGTGCSRSASAETDLLLRNLVDFSSGMKHSTEQEIAKDGVGRIPVHNERRHNYFPARLGVDETFTEKSLFTSDTNDGECGQTVRSPASEVNPRNHIINLPKHDALNQNLSSRNMVANRDGLCLHNTQATMRLMGKDLSVGTSYSDIVRTGARIIAPDASIDCSYLGSHTHQSWLWRTTTLGVSENHSTTSLDRNWNRNLLCDTSNYPFPKFCEPHVGLEFPPTILYPCGSLVSCPLTDKDLSFHGPGLGQQLNSVTFSQQQQPFPSNPEIAGLPSDYSNVGIGLLPDARKPSFGLPFSCTDSTRQSQPHWPSTSFESSRSDMSFFNPAEQLVSFYGSKSSAYINVGKTNKRLASVEEYPMKNLKIPKLPMQGGLNSEKEFFAGQQIRKSQI